MKTPNRQNSSHKLNFAYDCKQNIESVYDEYKEKKIQIKNIYEKEQKIMKKGFLWFIILLSKIWQIIAKQHQTFNS